jgi:hypothetical protein
MAVLQGEPTDTARAVPLAGGPSLGLKIPLDHGDQNDIIWQSRSTLETHP